MTQTQVHDQNLIVSQDETISRFNIIKGIELILSNETINSSQAFQRLEIIVSLAETVFKNQASRALFKKLLDDRVISAPEVMTTLGMDQATTYRVIRSFLALGLMEPLRTIRIKKKRGPPPRFYGLSGHWTQDHIPPAVMRLQSLNDPGMALVVNGTQLILDEYGLRPEGVKFTEIMERIKPLASGYSVIDLARQISHQVSQKGLPVWR